jgi:hypothetical protein
MNSSTPEKAPKLLIKKLVTLNLKRLKLLLLELII